MAEPINLTCPKCDAFVPDNGRYTQSPHHARHQRATCKCGAALIRHPDLDDDAWMMRG
jgi:hypothetical protein